MKHAFLIAVAAGLLGCGHTTHLDPNDPAHGLIKIDCVTDNGCHERAARECPKGYSEVLSVPGELTIRCK